MAFTHLLVVVASATLASARLLTTLEARAFTGASCNATFQWTNNAENISPCELAATVYGSCEGPTWNVPTLQTGNHYNIPESNQVNPCSCSWAAYNLISACTVCQGLEAGVQTWPYYITNCAGNTSTQYFPSSQALPDGTAIPYYAVQDPNTWPDKRFNLQAARAYHDSGKKDVVWQSSSSKKSSSAGPIAGGVVGGLAVILLAGGLAFYLYRKKQKRNQVAMTHIVDDDGRGHARTVSDLSQKSNGIGYGYHQIDRSFVTSPSSQVPMSPTSGTMHTHTSSVNSLSYFGSVNHSVGPYGVPSSPPPVARTTSPLSSSSPPPPAHVGLNREDIIVPFTLPPSAESSSRQGSNANLNTDRKRADGAVVPIYDSPNSLPSHLVQSGSQLGDNPGRTRLNPPAYSAVDEASIAPSRARPLHSKKGSGDTSYSIDSTTSGGVASAVQRHTSGGSVSAIDDVITQMGFTQGGESVSGSGGTLMTGQSQQFVRNQPFRPVIGNPDP